MKSFVATSNNQYLQDIVQKEGTYTYSALVKASAGEYAFGLFIGGSWQVFEAPTHTSEWFKLRHTFTTTGEATKFSLVANHATAGSPIEVVAPMFEVGSFASEARVNELDLLEEMANAEERAKQYTDALRNDFDEELQKFADDSVLSVYEKPEVKREWLQITGEKSIMESQATSAGVSHTTYTDAYNALDTYLNHTTNGLLINMAVDSPINATTYLNTFNAYYNAKIALGKAITDKLKADTEALGSDLATAVASSDVEYYLSTSPTSPKGGEWQTTAPAWVNGRFMFSRTKVTKKNGTITYSPSINGTNISGAKGDNGLGIQSTTITYQKHSNGTTAPTGTWTTTIPSLSAGEYLWTRTVITYTDSATNTSYSVSRDGSNGTNGRGIASSASHYQVSASGTTIPTGTWLTTIPSVPQGQYLWTRKTDTYTDSTTSVSYSTARQGADGAVGRGITMVREQYYLSDSNTSQQGGSWSYTPPVWVSGKFMWTRSEITYENPTGTGYSTPVLNQMLTAMEQNVTDLESKTDFISEVKWEGNTIASGALVVGNASGANAGVTGEGTTGDSTRFYAGSTYAGRNTANWRMRDDGMEEQWITFGGQRKRIRLRGWNGTNYQDTLYNPVNNSIAKNTVVDSNGYVTEQWYKDGALAYEVGRNGIYYVAEIPASFTPYNLVNMSSNTNTTDLTIFHNTIRSRMWQKTSQPSIFELRGNKPSFLYSAGQNVYSESNKQYEGYKNTQVLSDNITDGWYAFEQLGIMMEDGVTPSQKIVQLIKVQNGKVIQSGNTKVETDGYVFNQF